MSENNQQTTEQPKQEQPIGLTAEQEQGLNELTPDFEPKEEKEKVEKQTTKQKQQVAMVGMLVAGVFEVLSARLGDHWRLEAAEVKAIAEPASMVIDKYLPDFDSGPEFALLAAAGMVVVPRVLEQKQITEGAEDGDKSESESRQ